MLLNKALALTLNRISFLKDKEKQLLADILSSPEEILSCTPDWFSKITGRSIRTERWLPGQILRDAEQDFTALERGEFSLLVSGSAEYPRLLSEIFDPPFVLYVRGDAGILHDCSVAVVGTREPHPKAESSAFKWGLELACGNICTVSGLARGIDSAAHRGALSLQGKTAAVLGSGIDEIYPRRNLVLARSILDSGGALVSEFPPGTGAQKFHFPKRNRIISGLAGAVLLVQAPEKSGALITADFALEQGRDVYIDARCTGLPGNEGCMSLLYQGAGAVISPGDMHIARLGGTGTMDIHKAGNGNGSAIARIMELELTERILRYKNSLILNNEDGGKIAG
ncbi:MAG: DNA-processing protein DprA [Spirochaetales bacterium]|nr:DNA-processing protein DprA [Spirochaetales bacterium]